MPSLRTRIVVAAGICMLTSPGAGFAERDTALPTSGAPDASAPARAGSWIHIDPTTGRRVAHPTARAAIAADPAFSTSHEGLIQEPAPGGGMMLNLQGRFRSATTVTVGADGKPAVECVAPGTAAAGVTP